MTPISGKLYDGQISKPQDVQILFHQIGVELVYTDGHRNTLSWDRITSCDATGDEQRIEISAPEPGLPSQALLLPREQFEQASAGYETQLPASRPDQRSGKKWLTAVLVALPLMFVVVTTLATKAHIFVSHEQEVGLGRHAAAHIYRIYPRSTDKEAIAALEEIVERLAPADSKYEYQIHLLEDATVNAFAAPGGQLVVFTGLLEQAGTPDAIAGILAHEIAHVELRHGIKTLLRSAGVVMYLNAAIGGGFESLEVVEAAAELSSMLLVFSYSRKLEAEADAFARKTLQEHNIPLDGLAHFFREMDAKVPDLVEDSLIWLSTHPNSKERSKLLSEPGHHGPGQNPDWLENLRDQLQ